MYCTGDTPDDIARMDPKLINGVHFCDSLQPVPGEPITHKLREVWPGGGNIPLKAWVDAVISTGYDGWWSPELHSPKHWELDPFDVAASLREYLLKLFV
jgi:sugar phosphate isomerase/epimerase